MKPRPAVALSAGAIAIAVLAGCGNLTAGSASPATTAATISSFSSVSSSATTAPPVTITATPAAPTTVTATPPPVVIVPQAPVTVTQAPSTVYPQVPAPTSAADQQVANDTYTAESVVGWWIPQLSSNTDSASAMTKFSSIQGMAGHYADVFMVSSNDYSSFRYSGYYVTLIPRTFSTAAGANAWCDSEGFAIGNCFAKRLSHTAGPDGNTVERG